MQDTLSKGTARAAQLHLQRSPPAHSEDMPPEFLKTHVLYERSLHEASQARRVTRLPAQPRAWWCPQRANGRLISVDVCVSVCSADGNSYRPAGEAIREAAELVAARSPTSAGHRSRASLVLRLGTGHEKSIARVTHYGTKLHRGQIPVRLSQPMAALGEAYVRSYLGCGATHGQTVGASLRISYDGGRDIHRRRSRRDASPASRP